MDVVFECLGGPSTEFLDCGDVDAMQVEGHGSSGAKGVAADLSGLIAHFPETNGARGGSNGIVDAFGCDRLWVREEDWVVDCVNGCGDRASVGENVVDPAGQGFDRACGQAGALLVDALALFAGLLSGDGDGCRRGLLKACPG